MLNHSLALALRLVRHWEAWSSCSNCFPLTIPWHCADVMNSWKACRVFAQPPCFLTGPETEEFWCANGCQYIKSFTLSGPFRWNSEEKCNLLLMSHPGSINLWTAFEQINCGRVSLILAWMGSQFCETKAVSLHHLHFSREKWLRLASLSQFQPAQTLDIPKSCSDLQTDVVCLHPGFGT